MPKVQSAASLKEAIDLTGMTAREFAKKVEVREETVCRWKKGRCPRANEFQKMHAFFWARNIAVTVCGVPLGIRGKGDGA